MDEEELLKKALQMSLEDNADKNEKPKEPKMDQEEFQDKDFMSNLAK